MSGYPRSDVRAPEHLRDPWPHDDATRTDPPAREGGRWAGRVTLALVILVMGAVAVWLIALMRLQDLSSAAGPAVELGTADPGAGPAVPGGPLADPGGAAAPGDEPSASLPDESSAPAPDPAWVARAASAAGIPDRALEAYAAADLRTRADDPECALSWATLAGIGWVESRHGTIGGNALGADGRPVDGPIIGVALDGQGPVAAIPDTDDGVLDGDTTWDRAVGPLQFIPTTWARWGTDADGDGVADPQDIDDAALAAARYLCASGSPLTDPGSWRQAVLAYNRSDAYVADVLRATNFYAGRSLDG